YGAAGNAAVAFQREVPKAAKRQPPRVRPMQRIAQRRRFDAERSIDLERRLRTHGAIEGRFDRRAGEPDLDARAFPAQRGKKVAERKARFDRLVMPDETAARPETA